MFRLTLVSLCWLLVATGAASGQARPDGPRKILIDADPGIDDALAILFAMSSDALEVVGITTVFGNADIETATRNALYLASLGGGNVPVARGAGHPLSAPLGAPPDFVHGANGLGDVEVPPPSSQPVSLTAAEFIVETARRYPGQVTIVAVGRLTNLAMALALEPALPELVQEVVLMGGAVGVPGNVSPVAEANIAGDPHAADQVLTAPWSVTMVGLDVTTQVRLTDDILERMAQADERLGGFIYRITRFYKRFYESIGITGGFYVHDPSAVAYVIAPDLFGTEPARVRVDTDGVAAGQTIAVSGDRVDEWEPWREQPDVDVCREVDAAGLLRLFEDTITP